MKTKNRKKKKPRKLKMENTKFEPKTKMKIGACRACTKTKSYRLARLTTKQHVKLFKIVAILFNYLNIVGVASMCQLFQ